MEAKELRIGNLVTHTDYTESIFTVISIEIDKSGGYAIDTSGGKNGSWTWINPLECIEPIPLTAEWLEKLGLKKKGGHYLLDGYIQLVLDDVSNAPNRNVLIRNIYITDLGYVHELQNLYFALTGRELTTEENGK